MDDVSHIKMIAIQSRKFHEKESFEENVGHGNRTSDSEREVNDMNCGKLPESVRQVTWN
jgi:hypothetical protein